MLYFNAACIYRCWCVCWSVFSGLQWGDCRVLKLHCDSSRAYRMGENWQPLKRYYMCSRSLSLCLTGALGMKGKSSGKRDIGSRHGEVFVSILSIPSLSRNPNFHHSPTYRQIKAGWRGGFPQLRQLVTSLHKGGAAQSSRVRGGWSRDFKLLWIRTLGEQVVLKGHFRKGWSETWLGISELRVQIRTVTYDMRLSTNPEHFQKTKAKMLTMLVRSWASHSLVSHYVGFLKPLLLRLFSFWGMVLRWWCPSSGNARLGSWRP